jgi:nicotinate-nucleotide pyrophosphorylase (carboxylating)
VIVAKEAGIFCGGEVAREIFSLRNSSLKVKLHRKDGASVKRGAKVLTVKGRVVSILEAERVALNFLGSLSGIATLTGAYVKKVRGTKAKIYDTRKTTPLWRGLEKDAVKCGGGENHRFGLWDEVLVKENHWTAIHDLLEKTRCRYFGDCLVRAGLVPARQAYGRPRGAPVQEGRRIPIEIEVRNLKELAHLLEGTFVPDRILLDNFSVRELKRAVLFVKGLDRVLRTRYGIRRKLPELEASGRINLTNVHAVARTGVDRISIGRLTHSALSLDFSLRLL